MINILLLATVLNSFSVNPADESETISFSFTDVFEQAETAPARDLSIIVDASALMGRDRIASCKEALEAALPGLVRDIDRVAISSTRGGSFAGLSAFVPGNELKKAIEAGFGGVTAYGRFEATEAIHRAVLEQDFTQDRATVLVIISSGEGFSDYAAIKSARDEFYAKAGEKAVILVYAVNVPKVKMDNVFALTKQDRSKVELYRGRRADAFACLRAFLSSHIEDAKVLPKPIRFAPVNEGVILLNQQELVSDNQITYTLEFRVSKNAPEIDLGSRQFSLDEWREDYHSQLEAVQRAEEHIQSERFELAEESMQSHWNPYYVSLSPRWEAIADKLSDYRARQAEEKLKTVHEELERAASEREEKLAAEAKARFEAAVAAREPISWRFYRETLDKTLKAGNLSAPRRRALIAAKKLIAKAEAGENITSEDATTILIAAKLVNDSRICVWATQHGAVEGGYEAILESELSAAREALDHPEITNPEPPATLLEAIERSDFAAVRRLVLEGADITEIDATKVTNEMIRAFLIRNGASYRSK